MSGLLIGHFELGLLVLWAAYFGLGGLAGYHLCACLLADVARRAEEAERRAEKLRRGAAEALQRERARTLAAAIRNHEKSMASVIEWNRNATAAAALWRYRCRKVRAGASSRIRTLNEQLRAERGVVKAALDDMLRGQGPPRRIDQAGRDVTELPGLWDETDERAGG